MKFPLRSGVVRLFSAAVVDQVLLSAASFLMGLILVRYTSDTDYALFVILQSTLLLVTTVHSSAVCGPVAILAPKTAPEPKREMIGIIWHSQNRLRWPTLLAGVAVAAIGDLTGILQRQTALVLGIGIIAGWWAVERNYVRNALIIYSRPRLLLTVDAVYVVVLLAGTVWAAFGIGMPAVWVTVAFAVAAYLSNVVGDRAVAKQIGWPRGKAGPLWRDLRSLSFWAVVGAFIYWLFSRSYVYILATRLDLKAVADVNVVRLMVMPAILLILGLQSVLTPVASAWIAEVGFDRMLRRLNIIILAVGVCELAYFGLIWMFRGWVMATVMHKHIGQLDLFLLLWLVWAFISLFREVLVTAVYAFGRLRWLAWQIGVSAAIALCIAWFGIPWWGAAAALIALVVGEVTNLAGIIYAIRKMQTEIRLNGVAAYSDI